jgi:hypothetical protein
MIAKTHCSKHRGVFQAIFSTQRERERERIIKGWREVEESRRERERDRKR